MPPLPSHRFVWQSPAVCVAAGGSTATFEIPHTWPPPVRLWVSSVSLGKLVGRAPLTQGAAWQWPLVQSPLPVQTLPLAHLVVHEPPQSTSVSVPFFTVSLHAGTEQTLEA